MKHILTLIIILFFFTLKAKVVSKLPTDTFLYGNFQVSKILTDIGVSKAYDWLLTASFFDKITHSIVTVNSVKYGNVYLKSDIHFNGNYFDTTGIQFPDSIRQCQVNGAGNIPSFTYTPNITIPSFTGYSLVTTGTVTIFSGITIPFSGISNATNITVVISDGVNDVVESFAVNNNSLSRLTPNATLNINSITIPSADLNVLSPTNNGFINIIISNVDYQFFSGKRIAFSKNFMYKRNRVVIQ